MDRTPVRSSNRKSVGYDPDQELLEVEFLHGGIEQYRRVPRRLYNGLMQASSHGTYFATYIRDRYPTSQVRSRRRS